MNAKPMALSSSEKHAWDTPSASERSPVPGRSQRILPILFALLLALPFVSQAAAATLTRTSAFTYDDAGLLKKEIIEPDDSKLCLVTEYTYDNYGNKASATTRNCGGTAPEAIAPSGEPGTPGGDAVITPRTSSTIYAAGSGGAWPAGQFPTTSTNALGQFETRTFDPKWGAVLTLTGPNNLTTTWTYDNFGRKTLETRADDTKTQWQYLYCAGVNGGSENCPVIGGAAGAWVLVTTPLGSDGNKNGAIGKTYYDALDRPIRVETEGLDGRPIYQDTEYDSLGRAYKKSRPYYQNDTSYWATQYYDSIGRVIEVREPVEAGNPISTTTLYEGLSVTVTNPNGQTRATVKNSQGQVVRVTDAQGKTLTFAYDSFGNLQTTTDALGNVTTLFYDLRGRKIQMLDPDMGQWDYAYNALGQLIRQTDPKGRASTPAYSTAMTYDLLGRMTIRLEDGLKSYWYYDNDKNGVACNKGVGKLCQVETDTGYNKTIAYDALGRPLSAATTIANNITYTDSVTYNTATGRAEARTWPSGFAVKYVYNTRGYLTDVQNSAGSASYWQAGAMDAEGHLLLQTHGNGVQTQQVYDAATGRLKEIHAGTGDGVQNLAYQYDALGNVMNRRDNSDPNPAKRPSEDFTYDTLNRLETATVSSTEVGTVAVATRFTYDALGNIQTREEPLGATPTLINTYTYLATGNTRPHAVSKIDLPGGGHRSYTYDLNGNLATQAQYDSANQPIQGGVRNAYFTSFNMPSVIHDNATNVNLELSRYGPEHQRLVGSLTTAAGTRETIYLHPDNSGGLFYERETKTDNTIEERHFISAGGQSIAIVKLTGTTWSTVYLHRDHLGSIAAITDGTGAVIERMAYEPFGKRRFQAGTTDPSNTLAGINTNRGFTDHEQIDALGLVHMNGRIYDPAIGRFLSADPQVQDPSDLQTYNRYAYARNNPLHYVDPSGYGFLDDVFDFIGKTLDAVFDNPAKAVVTIAVAYYTGQGLESWLGNSAVASGEATAFANVTFLETQGVLAASSLTAAGSAAVGAGVGFTLGALNGGDLQSGLKGAASGAILGGMDGYYGSSWSLERVAAKSFGGGIAAALQGGRFEDGLLNSATSSGARYIYNTMVGYDVTAAPGENRPGEDSNRQVYQADQNGRLSSADRRLNVIGPNIEFDGSWWDPIKQGGAISRALNMVPGGNAIARFDDYLQSNVNNYFNVNNYYLLPITIPLSVLATLPALLDRVPVYQPLNTSYRRR